MRFYNEQHEFYVGIDLHAREMFACVLNRKGDILLHRNMKADRAHVDRLVQRFPGDFVIAVECIFTWYWIADFCDEREIPFVLGHALYMKAIHGGKSKNDKMDSHKIATMLRAGMLPEAYVYPREMRATRDLLRRREYFMHQQSELLTHVKNTNTQYNYPAFQKRIAATANRHGLEERFEEPSARKSIEADLHLLDVYHRVLLDLEAEIKRQAKHHDSDAEASSGNNKIGNAHLKWAFSEAAVMFLRDQEDAKRLQQRLTQKSGKAKALSIIAQKLGRTVYFMLKRKEPFVAKRFFGDGVQGLVA